MKKIITTLIISGITLIIASGCRNGNRIPSSDEPVLFAEHISPILQKNCSKCHNSNGAAPFSLITYNQVAPKGTLIKYVTENRIMPPWPADPEYSHFANETYLTDNEIALIKRWVDEGCKPGDTASSALSDNDKNQSQDQKPDLIVHFPKPIKIPGNNTDQFLVVKLPVPLPSDKIIKAIEFVPGKKRLVHHMNAHVICYEDGKKIRSALNEPFYVNQDQPNSREIHKELNLLNDDGTYASMTPSVCNYLPGSQFSFYPKEIGGYYLKKNSVFYLNDLHYGPSPLEEYDSSYFRIYYGNEKPKRPVSEFQIGTLGLVPVVPKLRVPADSIKTFHITFTVPQDISVLSLIPHMHLIGKSFWAYALTPGGDTIRLIKIPRWDFRWQYFYQPPHLLKIPRGSIIYVEGVYDNTSNNPNNPFSPPRLIEEREGSMKTTDEMFQLIITYVPWEKGDEKISQGTE